MTEKSGKKEENDSENIVVPEWRPTGMATTPAKSISDKSLIFKKYPTHNIRM